MNEITKDHELEKENQEEFTVIIYLQSSNWSHHRKTSGFVEIFLLKSHSVVVFSRKNKTAFNNWPAGTRATVE